ncbi:MAG: transcription antitermination factor NusB [Planctomycetaceae bacterium]|nr:transcription antitermination factor NusB [Planctomycetaceae bacterium]
MKKRSTARKVAVQMLYLKDLNPDAHPDSIRATIVEELSEEELQRFAWKLFSGVMENRAELDEKIVQIAQNWSLSRMAPTDRNVLRLGAFELLHSDTHYRIVIDEAVELARLFGNKQSGQFVNGILDKLIPFEKRDTAPPETSEEE